MTHKIRKATFANAAGSLIDVEYQHPEFGWIPFTASADDQPLGTEIFAKAKEGAVASYVAPIELPSIVPASVSDRQFFQALAIRGEITEHEALEAVGPGIIPAAMLALIDQLPEAERFGAKMLIRGATVFERANPLADLIGSLFGWDADALDEFWTFASAL